MKKRHSAPYPDRRPKRKRGKKILPAAVLQSALGTSAGAASSFKHVLLKHSTVIGDRRLELSVAAADATRPDQLAVHVRYDEGEVAAIVSAAGHQDEVGGGRSNEAHLPTPAVQSAAARHAGDEHRNCMAVIEEERQTLSPEHDPKPGASQAGVITGHDVNIIVKHEVALHLSPGQDQDEEAQASPAGLLPVPTEILQYIISCLSWKQQLGVRRVSRRWRAAVDACLSRRRELRVGGYDFPSVLDDSKLERLLQSMPALTRLCIAHRRDHRKLNIETLSRQCRNLVDVNLAHFRVDAWSLTQLCVSCPQLEGVSLARHCDDKCVELLLKHLPRLRRLNLQHTEVTGRCLARLPASLEWLSVAYCKKLQPFWVRQVGRCTQLRGLDVSGVSGLGDDDLTEVLALCPQLERLQAYFCNLSMSCMQQLARCERLRNLRVFERWPMEVGYSIPAMLAGLSQLERLDLGYIGRQSANWMRHLANFPLLRELHLSGVGISADFENMSAVLSGCPQLKVLSLRWHNDSNSSLVCSSWMRQLGQCKQLSELQIGPLGFRAADLAAGLANCPRLERLSMAGVTERLERCLPPAGLPVLRHLEVPMSSGVTNDSLRWLPYLLPALRTLSLKGCNAITEHGLSICLPRLRNLQFLDLQNVPAVTDTTLRRLRGRRLKKVFLDVDSGGVTREGITRLVTDCPSLDFLFLHSARDDATRMQNTVDRVIQNLDPARDFTLGVDEKIRKRVLVLPPCHLMVTTGDGLRSWEKLFFDICSSGTM